MEIKLKFMEFWGVIIGTITIVASAVTVFWRRQIKLIKEMKPMITLEDVREEIAREAFPMEKGARLEERVAELSRKADRILTNQEVFMNRFNDFKEEIKDQIVAIRLENKGKK